MIEKLVSLPRERLSEAIQALLTCAHIEITLKTQVLGGGEELRHMVLVETTFPSDAKETLTQYLERECGLDLPTVTKIATLARILGQALPEALDDRSLGSDLLWRTLREQSREFAQMRSSTREFRNFKTEGGYTLGMN